MGDKREIWYDPLAKVSVTMVDVAESAAALVRGHLCGPTAGAALARAIAAVALLGGETSEADESVTLEVKCSGPLGGVLAECTAAGRLRGYTVKKVLDEFDGVRRFDERAVMGECRLQVTHSAPGRILSQGVSNSLDGYLAGSLQRRARIFVDASVTDECEVALARGLMVEAMPDSIWNLSAGVEPLDRPPRTGRRLSIAAPARKLLDALGLGRAQRRSCAPLAFGCTCSPERAAAMVAALGEDDRAAMPPVASVTCHLCGRTYTVKTK